MSSKYQLWWTEEDSWSGQQMKRPSLFSGHFDTKQFRYNFQQPYSCDRCSMLRSVDFRSSFVCRFPLDPYGVNDTDGMFPLFTSRWLGSST